MPLKNSDESKTQTADYQDDTQYDEEPEAEAKTYNKPTQSTYNRQRKSQGLVTTTPSILNNRSFIGKGSPRFTGEKKNSQVSPILNNCNNSSLKKGMNRYGSQNSVLQATSFKKDEQKSEMIASGQSAI